MIKPVFLIFLLGISFIGRSQIAPPGLTKKGGASWFAIGIKQQLKNENSSLSSYIGTGRAGTSMTSNPFQNHVLFVTNIAYKKSFRNKLYISPSLSYRHQEIHIKSIVDKKQEVRIALGIGKLWTVNRYKFSIHFKQEFRKFFDDSFRNWDESIQLRSRLKLSTRYALTKNKKHSLSTHVELLFSTTEHIDPNIYWEKFSYADTRLSLFYSYLFPKPNLTLSIGYMLDLIGTGPTSGANYISLDLVWKNPFHAH